MTTTPAVPVKPLFSGCTCGKGRVGGLLCGPCFETYDDATAPPKVSGP